MDSRTHARRVAAAGIAALAALALAAPAGADWVKPSQRVDAREGSVVNGDIGAWQRSVAFFTQPPAGQPATASRLYATESAPGAPAWTQPPLPVALPEGVGAGASYQVEVARNGNARGAFLSGGKAYLLTWDAGAAPAVAATPILSGPVTGLRLDVAPDGTTHAVAVTTGSTPTVKYVRVAPDGTPQPEQELGNGAEPDVAASSAGVAVAYTKTLPSNDKRVVVRRQLGSASEFTSEGPGTLDGPNPLDDQPGVAISESGAIAVAYRSTPAKTGGGQIQPPSKVRFARWLPAAFAIDDARDLSDPPAPPTPPEFGPNQVLPRVAVDDAERVTFVWESRPSSGSSIVGAELVGTTLSARQVLSTGTQVSLGVGPTGFAVVTFNDPPGTTPQTIAMERPTGNLWGARTTLTLSGGTAGPASSSFAPRVAVSPSQADAFLLQTFGSGASALTGAVVARNVLAGTPPVDDPVTDARGCPPQNETRNGTTGDDALAGTEGDDNLIGDAGNDRMAGLAGNDCLRGEDGNDDLGGDAGDDRLEGGAGDDYARGNAGNDVVLGELGDDRLSGSAGTDQLSGAEGDDRMSGGSEADALDGGVGNDRIFAGAGNDSALGGDGNDLLSGGGGRDRLMGDAGDDRLVVRSGPGRLFGGAGDDRLRGGTQRDFLIAEDGTDRLFGYGGNDLLVAGDGRDTASGGPGDDRIAGRDGNDALRGGTGDDRITAGGGNDRVWGDGGRDRIDTASGNDVVHAADGAADRIRCGAGDDLVVADPRDRVARSCERVRIGRATLRG